MSSNGSNKASDLGLDTSSIILLSWDFAPHWAEHQAMDGDGTFYWHEYSPDYEEDVWRNPGRKERCIHPQHSSVRRPSGSN